MLNTLLKTIFITHWYFVLSVYTCITFALFPQKDVQTIFRKHYVYADKKLTGVSGLVDYVFSNNHFVIFTNRSNLQNDDLTIMVIMKCDRNWPSLSIIITLPVFKAHIRKHVCEMASMQIPKGIINNPNRYPLYEKLSTSTPCHLFMMFSIW